MAEQSGPLLGTLLVLDVGEAAAGGSCVAHEPGGRVVFVRHALPGERVRAVVTEDRGGSFCRADALEILSASPDRVEPPCPHAGPGRCGGCDWQHASGPAQRELKSTVIREQFSRIAKLELADAFAGVEALPGGLLGWRSRNVYAVDRAGRPGLRRHRSHEIEPVAHCPLARPGVGDAGVLDDRWPGLSGVEVARGDDAECAVLTHRPGPGRQARGRRPPDRVRVVSGPATLRHQVRGRTFDVAASGFWQVHPAAAATLAQAMLDALEPQAGETALDLYAGAGLLTAALAEAVGADGGVVGIETDPHAVADATANLADLPWAEVRRGRVGDLANLGVPADVIVVDPPRAGAGAAVMNAIADLHPRAVAYVSCDAATLARDVGELGRRGWTLPALRAFDAFPMTHHVECVATLRPGNSG